MNKPVKPPQDESNEDVASPSARRTTTQVMVGNVAVGGGAPIVVQSMTNTDTADIEGTVATRSSASDDLSKALQLFLGPADAQGQHTFSLAGTL